MFNDFINWLKEKDARFEIDENRERDTVYVYSKVEYDLIKKHPRKFKTLYLPYIRISDHGGEFYTRINGVCGYMPICKIKELIEKEYLEGDDRVD